MNRRALLAFGVLLAALPAGAHAEGAAAAPAVWVEAELNTPAAFLGQPFKLVVTAGARNGEVKLPGADAVLSGCRLKAYREQDVSQRHEGYTARQGVYTLAAFVLDQADLPPLDVRFTWPDGTTSAASTPPLVLKVPSVAPAPGFDLRDPRPPLTPPRTWPYALAVPVLLLVWWGFRGRKRRRPRTPVLPAPHLEAFAALEALGKSRVVAEGRVDLYFTELSRVLRRYCSRRYELPALELPRTGIYTALRRLKLPLKACRLINSLLIRADLVKFAKVQVDFPRIAQAQRRAQAFVTLTRPAPAAAPSARGRRARV
jgi:hypothetical protein